MAVPADDIPGLGGSNANVNGSANRTSSINNNGVHSHKKGDREREGRGHSQLNNHSVTGGNHGQNQGDSIFCMRFWECEILKMSCNF